MEKPLDQYKPIEKLELKKASFQKFKKIHCPSCHNEVNSDNINLQNSFAKCSNCNVIFSIEEEMEKIKNKTEAKQQYFRPEGIDLFYYQDELDITLDQHIQGLDIWAMTFSPLIAIGLFMNFFLAENPISIYFPIVFSLVAIYYIYKAINYYKYKTYIAVNDKFLSIKYRPNNLKKDRNFVADDIDQLYLKPSNEMPGHYIIHMVINGMDGQKHEKLMAVNSLSKAKYLEQEIEKYLNIVDRKVLEANA